MINSSKTGVAETCQGNVRIYLCIYCSMTSFSRCQYSVVMARRTSSWCIAGCYELCIEHSPWLQMHPITAVAGTWKSTLLASTSKYLALGFTRERRSSRCLTRSAFADHLVPMTVDDSHADLRGIMAAYIGGHLMYCCLCVLAWARP
jgi:hypothetical protein